MAGLGLADEFSTAGDIYQPTAAAPVRESAATVPALTMPAAAPRERGVGDWLSRVGYAMSAISAGAQGKPIRPYGEDEEERKMKRLDLSLKFADVGVKQLDMAPDQSKRSELAKAWAKRMDDSGLFGTDMFLPLAEATGVDAKSILELAGDAAPILRAMHGENFKKWQATLADPQRAKDLRERVDEVNAESIQKKVGGALETLAQKNPEAAKALEQAAADGKITLAEVRQLNEKAGGVLTPSEMRTLAKNENLQLQYGITTAKTLQKTQEEAAKGPSGQLAELQKQRATLEAEARTNPDAARRLREVNAKIEKEITITGRTDADVAATAAAKAQGKGEGEQAAEDAKPIPANVRAMLNLPDDVKTLGEARAKGVTIPDEKTAKELADGKAGVMTAYDTAEKLSAIIAKSPDANTWVAQGAALVNDLRQNAEALARNGGVEFKSVTRTAAAYEKTLKELGIENAKTQALIVNLAYSAALAQGQKGQSVSNRDVENMLRQIGGKSQDPEALSAVLDQFVAGLDGHHRNRVETITNSRPSSVAVERLSKLDGSKPLTPAQERAFKRLSDEEKAELKRRRASGNAR